MENTPIEKQILYLKQNNKENIIHGKHTNREANIIFLKQNNREQIMYRKPSNREK